MCEMTAVLSRSSAVFLFIAEDFEEVAEVVQKFVDRVIASKPLPMRSQPQNTDAPS